MKKLLIALMALSLASGAALAQDTYLELEGVADNDMPCTDDIWHELYPAFCTPWVQEGYVDNCDGVLSACDYIKFDGIWYHIEWVGPAVYHNNGIDPFKVDISENPNPGEDPVCEVWHELYPTFCSMHHVDQWIDNGSGEFDVCDEIIFDNLPGTWHVDVINIAIRVIPEDPPRAEQIPTLSQWGLILLGVLLMGAGALAIMRKRRAQEL